MGGEGIERGQALAGRFGVRYSPAFVVIDARGALAYRVPDSLVPAPTPACHVFDAEGRRVSGLSRLDRATLDALVAPAPN